MLAFEVGEIETYTMVHVTLILHEEIWVSRRHGYCYMIEAKILVSEMGIAFAQCVLIRWNSCGT